MNKRIPVIMMTGLAFLLLTVGMVGAQVVLLPRAQTLLPGSLIPKFVDPLPVATTAMVPGVTVVNATAGGGYNIHLYEFWAQILPNVAIPLTPAGKRGGGATLPAGTPSRVWGYLTDADVTALTANPVRPSYLGPVVLAARGIETQPTYLNELPNGINSLVQDILPVDQTLDWANPLNLPCPGNPPVGSCGGIYGGPQPAVPHLHGGEVLPAYDGGPDAWWTPGLTATGSGFPGTTFIYPNAQQAGTIWFHDHALGITRLNVYAGMAGLHIITDTLKEPPQAGATCSTAAPFGGCLPKFPEYDIPLIIQDRSFDTQGQLFYNLASNPQPNPGVHPFWIPEFIGDTIVVNGKTWPFLNVEPRKYRFRLLNGSNARFYNLTLSNGAPFTVIATDDGYLNAPVVTPNVIIGPGERYEVIVDFAALPVGTQIIMKNSARTPFPGGAAPVKNLTDTVMQFRVIALNPAIADATTLPTNLRPNNPIVDIKTTAVAAKPVPGACPAPGAFPTTNTIVRQLTLNEVIGPGGPLELVLNNTKYNGSPSITAQFGRRDSEQPAVGDTEIWEIINITADAHPMHMHLASFQILNRQPFDAAAYTAAYAAALTTAFGVLPDGKGPPLTYLQQNADCAIGGNPPISPYLFAPNRKRGTVASVATPPLAYENGWKDTAIMYPGEVTRIVIRWAETDRAVASVSAGNLMAYPFDPTLLINGVGYVWHCHIIDHEDNEMMRPYIVGPARQIIQ